MKVLVASNYLHTVPGGGELVFLQSQALLRQRGHQVVPFAVGEDRSLDSEWRPYFPTQREVPLRPSSVQRLRETCRLPDGCPNYRLLTHDRIRHRCLYSNNYFHTVVHRCTEGSLYKSASAALENYINTWRSQYSKIGLFISPSTF